MPFLIIRNDITKVWADAVVNTANTELLEGSGVSRAIYLAAGEEKLQKACRKIGHCDPGKAVITKGFGLPARYIIHAVGPVWRDGASGEEELLYSAYMESMKLAKKRRLASIAFPLISSGYYGYPKERALKTAVSAIRDFLKEHEMLVWLVIYDDASFVVSRRLFASIEEYIDGHYVEEHREEEVFRNSRRMEFREAPAAQAQEIPLPDEQDEGLPVPGVALEAEEAPVTETASEDDGPLVPGSASETKRPDQPRCLPPPPACAAPFSGAAEQVRGPISTEEKTRQLDDIMKRLGETFSQMLLRLIDERGLTDPEVYHKANIDRKLFSKIRNNRGYSPNKKTVLAFAIALELSLDETVDLLRTAGYSLSESSRFDVILSFFLEKKIYDIFEINEMLFYYGQPILGG